MAWRAASTRGLPSTTNDVHQRSKNESHAKTKRATHRNAV